MPTPDELRPLLNQAGQYLDEFRSLIVDIPYERKGILFSEMFFFWLCARSVHPRRILESGRARGQSTLILSHCFPDAEIISVEHDPNSPDVAVAAERLAGRDNVQQLFGDATQLLPKLAQAGDVALIDGPKGYRGLRLALKLLAKGKTPLIFVHDTALGSLERDYLHRQMPETIYSDLPSFTAISHALDQGAWDQLPVQHQWTNQGAPAAGYGFSLACIPLQTKRSYFLLKAKAIIEGTQNRLLK